MCHRRLTVAIWGKLSCPTRFCVGLEIDCTAAGGEIAHHGCDKQQDIATAGSPPRQRKWRRRVRCRGMRGNGHECVSSGGRLLVWWLVRRRLAQGQNPAPDENPPNRRPQTPPPLFPKAPP